MSREEGEEMGDEGGDMRDKFEMGRPEEDIGEDFLRCGFVDFAELNIYWDYG